MLRGGCWGGGVFYKERKGRRGGGFWGWLLALVFLDGLAVKKFATEVGGLGASRWLLEGRILQREKESGEGGT